MKVILTAEQIELLKLGNTLIKNEPHKEYYYLPYWFEHNLDTDEWYMHHLGKPLPDELLVHIQEMREFTTIELIPEEKINEIYPEIKTE